MLTTLIYLFNDKNQILLGMKKRGFGKGKWSGFGGKLSGDETIRDCALRELYEESGIRLFDSELQYLGKLNFEFDSNADWNNEAHIFVGIYNGNIQESDEMKPAWFDIKDIPFDNMWNGANVRISRIINGEKDINIDFLYNAGTGNMINYSIIKSNLIIKDSMIEGKGVFANKNFTKGEIVIARDLSQVINKDTFEKMAISDKKYVNTADGKYIIVQEPERYVNHSCDANTNPIDLCDVAIKNIKKGEEITTDYSKQIIEDRYIDCKCGTINCKGRIRI